MPTPTRGPRLGGSPQHERLILANLAQSLFEHGKIATTEAKAKRLRPFAEKLITSAKRGTLHSRREVLKVISSKDVVHKLFAEIGPSFATREGGYTRIIKTAPRKGDNAPMALIELIAEETVTSAANRTARRAARTRSSAPAPSAGLSVAAAAAPLNAEPAGDSATEAGETPAEDTTSSQTEAASTASQAEGDDDRSAGSSPVTVVSSAKESTSAGTDSTGITDGADVVAAQPPATEAGETPAEDTTSAQTESAATEAPAEGVDPTKRA